MSGHLNSLEEELTCLEELFWCGGRDIYRQHMHPDAVMEFPEPVGKLQSDEILDTIDQAARWGHVEMNEVAIRQEQGKIVLDYHARGLRQGAPSYQAWCTSVYERDKDGELKLTYHEQRPVDLAA